MLSNRRDMLSNRREMWSSRRDFRKCRRIDEKCCRVDNISGNVVESTRNVVESKTFPEMLSNRREMLSNRREMLSSRRHVKFPSKHTRVVGPTGNVVEWTTCLGNVFDPTTNVVERQHVQIPTGKNEKTMSTSQEMLSSREQFEFTRSAVELTTCSQIRSLLAQCAHKTPEHTQEFVHSERVPKQVPGATKVTTQCIYHPNPGCSQPNPAQSQEIPSVYGLACQGPPQGFTILHGPQIPSEIA